MQVESIYKPGRITHHASSQIGESIYKPGRITHHAGSQIGESIGCHDQLPHTRYLHSGTPDTGYHPRNQEVSSPPTHTHAH